MENKPILSITNLAETPEKYSLSSIKDIPVTERSKIRISKRSFYSDTSWDFNEELIEIPRSEAIINFNFLLPDGSRLDTPKNNIYLTMVKEYVYSLIFDPIPSNPKVTTIRHSMRRGIKSLVCFMWENAITYFSHLNEHDMARFHQYVLDRENSSSGAITNRTLSARVAGLTWLYQQSNKMLDGIRVWPLGDFNTESEWCKHHAQKVLPRHASTTVEMPDSVATQIFENALHDLTYSDSVLEVYSKHKGHDFKIKRTFLKNTVGPKKWKVEALNPFDWSEYGFRNSHDVKSLRARITAAGYIVIAFLTGMRMHEVLSIRSGVDKNWEEKEVRIGDLRKKLYFIKSKTRKLERNPTDYLWQTVPIAKRALESLDKIKTLNPPVSG
ncbi:hypothetical protein [Halomonas sp. LBP4]|uniref:hypothetical protein n=1 Tax=Halomonas sp. LBP4 TaxID=2044917 RepID=UPI0011B37ABF|nr:hypothetical protein [Halomonas sp. LBP4]